MLDDNQKLAANASFASRQFGRVRYSAELVEDAPEVIRKLYERIIPTSVTYDYATRYFEVVGMSNDFESLEEGEHIPNYFVTVKLVKRKNRSQGYKLAFTREEA